MDFHPGDTRRYLYIIHTGVMEQRKPNGVLRAKLGPQDLFGFTFLDDHTDGEESYSAIAAESTLLYLIPHEALEKLLEDHPEYAEHFASQAQIRIQNALTSSGLTTTKAEKYVKPEAVIINHIVPEILSEGQLFDDAMHDLFRAMKGKKLY
nr:Crp/Fnr family transcriptional regulator [Marinomonas ushuaiensis]